MVTRDNLLDRTIGNPIGVIVPPIAAPCRLIGERVAINMPAVKGIQVQFDGGHDRVGIAKVNHVGNPLGDLQLGLVGITLPQRVVNATVAIGVNLPVVILQQHGQHKQVLGKLLTGQGVITVHGEIAVVVVVKKPRAPEGLVKGLIVDTWHAEAGSE